jgi:hypothetical protein
MTSLNQISCLHVWTVHLDGLAAILDHRCLIDPNKRTPLTSHLIEVIGLLDLPTFTVGSPSTTHRFWSCYVAPHYTGGIEPCSGLPRSLVNILAQLGSPGIEAQLFSWPGEIGDDYTHNHLWEAVRFAAVLHSRALLTHEHVFLDTDVLLFKILASIDALVSTKRKPFGQPVRHMILYPLFSVGLYTVEASSEREYVCRCFKDFVDDRRDTLSQTAQAVLLEVWARRGTRPRYASLRLANEFALQMKLELHLY